MKKQTSCPLSQTRLKTNKKKMRTGFFGLALFLPVLLSSLTLSHQANASCQYSPQEKSLQLSWSAFKTTQKLAVHGKFKSPKNRHKLKKSYESLTALLNAVQVEVDMLEVDTGAPGRDQTLKQSFFSQLAGKSITKASLSVSQENKEHSGSATLHLTFNGKTKDVPVTFLLDPSGLLTVKGTFDVLDFGADSALASLNKACFDLHKGPDGVSKTWSTVDFSASATIKSSCTQ